MKFLDQIEKKIYSNEFNHIYLYEEINNDTVLRVKLQIDELNKTQEKDGVYSKPKPIVLHLNSPGGGVRSGISLMRSIVKSRVPIITFIEGICASAATLIAVIAKYRLISKYGLMLIHQYSDIRVGKHENLRFKQKVGDKLIELFKNIYLGHSKISKNKIDELLSHDYWLSPEECLKYGLVDKILLPTSSKTIEQYYKNNPEYRLPIKIANIKTNFNHIYIYGEYEEGLEFWETSTKTVLSLHNVLRGKGTPKPILLHIGDGGQFDDLYEILPIINTILMSIVPIYSIIDGPSSETTILYSILCHQRYIYQYAYISIDFVGIWKDSSKYEDLVRNTKLYRRFIHQLLKKYTKLPEYMLKNLFKERFLLTAEETVRYGICDQILS